MLLRPLRQPQFEPADVGKLPWLILAPFESKVPARMSAVGVTDDCAALDNLARAVCAQKARGVDLATVVQKLDIATKDQNLSNFIIAGAQLYLCPEREAST